jgi:hypothetical protein
MGSADLIEEIKRLLGPRQRRAGQYIIFVCASLWVATSTALAFVHPFVFEWFKSRGVIEASFAAAKKPNLCGLLFYDHDWGGTGGYAHLHRNAPFYAFVHKDGPPIGSIVSVCDEVCGGAPARAPRRMFSGQGEMLRPRFVSPPNSPLRSMRRLRLVCRCNPLRIRVSGTSAGVATPIYRTPVGARSLAARVPRASVKTVVRPTRTGFTRVTRSISIGNGVRDLALIRPEPHRAGLRAHAFGQPKFVLDPFGEPREMKPGCICGEHYFTAPAL